MTQRWGLIAGNGRFPLLVLDSAKAMGLEMTVVAIHEETWPEIEQHTAKVHWIGSDSSEAHPHFSIRRCFPALMAGRSSTSRFSVPSRRIGI